jgi:NAD(P)-dependent dehydrogenase (short-subunit alcohol dehydrogenase family)
MSRAVLVTGASTGLGLEIAVHLAQQGYRVYASMRDPDARADLDAEAARRGVQPDVLQLDVTDPSSIEQAVGRIVAETGGIYALINNAGVGLRGYFEDLDDDEIRGVFEANVFGTMNVTRAVLPHMRTAGQGRIVVIGSVGGRIASFGISAYCATKFAQEGFSEALAQELAPLGIGVSLVEPGIVKTERWGKNRAIARRASAPSSPYAARFRAGEELANRLVGSAPARPIDVAHAVQQALDSARPSLRYVVGWRPNLMIVLRRIMPNGVFERLYFGSAAIMITRTITAERVLRV